MKLFRKWITSSPACPPQKRSFCCIEPKNARKFILLTNKIRPWDSMDIFFSSIIFVCISDWIHCEVVTVLFFRAYEWYRQINWNHRIASHRHRLLCKTKNMANLQQKSALFSQEKHKLHAVWNICLFIGFICWLFELSECNENWNRKSSKIYRTVLVDCGESCWTAARIYIKLQGIWTGSVGDGDWQVEYLVRTNAYQETDGNMKKFA